MEDKSSVTVNFANLSYAFMKFQEQYKNLCQNISEEKINNIGGNIKRLRSFIFEYLVFVKSSELREEFIKYLNNLNEELSEDKEYSRLVALPDKTKNQQIIYLQKYYSYLIKIFKLIGNFGDELSKTFMPNKSDREKLFKYWNNNSFFEQFTYYKSNTSDKLASFSLNNFRDNFSYFLGFYFAYYLFIDEKSRFLCEKVFSNILNIVLNGEILKIMVSNYGDLSNEKKKLVKEIDFDLHNALSNIFFRCNYSYSQYGILPRMEQKILIDRRTI